MTRTRVDFWFLVLILTLAGPARANGVAPAATPKPSSEAFVVPDLGRFLGTWLWIQSEGLVATSNPESKGVARTLVLNPDLSYEFHQRRDTRDSVLCAGRFLYTEQSGPGGGSGTDYLEFEGWHEPYERRMTADFDGPDTLFLSGGLCENCPEHTFVRGRSVMFGASVKKGETFRRDLGDGLRFELTPLDYGWDIGIKEASRPDEDLSRFTPPFHFVPNPCFIEGWHFRNKANTGPNQGDVNAPQKVRDFIFSREVGRTIEPRSADQPDSLAAAIDRIGRHGRGVLTIEELTLDPPAPGKRAGIVSMRFTVAVEEVRRRAQATRAGGPKGASQ